MKYWFEKFLRFIKRNAGERIINLFAFVLSLGGRRVYDYITHGLITRQVFTATNATLKVEIHSPDYIKPDSSELEVITRIFNAYKKAKEDQKGKSRIFSPSSLWKDQLDKAYSPLLQGLEKDDIKPFHFFLSNFGSWKIPTGIENSGIIHSHASNQNSINYFENKMMAPLVQWWINNESQGRGLELLAHPKFGNQCGAYVNGHFITIGSFFSDIYSRLITEFIKTKRPIISEIGGGYGKLFYFLSRKISKFCYLDFDLPESLACASYFLLKAHPNKRFLLYGEGALSEEIMHEYDFIMLPSFEISKIPENSTDIFINTTSLGEMEPGTAQFFIGEICRSAKIFFHANHEYVRNYFKGGSASLLNNEYPIPSNQFELVVRYPDICHNIFQGTFDYNSDIFWYFYRKI